MWRVFFGAGIYFLCVSVGPSFSTDFDLKSLPGPGPSHPTVPISRETTGGIPPSTIKIAPPTSLPLSDPCDVTGKSLYELQKIYKHCRIRTAPANTEDEEVTGGLDEPQIANAKALRRFFRSDLRVEPSYAKLFFVYTMKSQARTAVKEELQTTSSQLATW